jgi:broad specificity phosphatase PhoE
MIGQPYPPHESKKEIVLVRHAQSQANLDGIWNGRTDGPLSEGGEASLEHLGRRLSKWDFDAVISSPLSRARRTAEAFSTEVHIDEEVTEIDLGRWEGLEFEVVQSRYGDKLKEAFATGTVPMGETGETLQQANQRSIGAVDRLFEEMGDDQRVAVVTHGGFMQSVLRRHLAGESRRPHAFSANTAITRLIWQHGRVRLASFNDTGHFGPRSQVMADRLAKGQRILSLIRHGRTLANVERRWQGRGDWDLDEEGHRQAELLSGWYGKHPTVYTSPLKRAVSTAGRVALNGFVHVEGLMELHMGEWEGLTTDEIFERWPEDVEHIYRHGKDLPRGGTGETWAQLTDRFSGAIAGLSLADGEPTLVVAHGGAIRSYVSSLTKTDDTHSQSLYTPDNTSVTHIALTEDGPEILDYAVATHLEPAG